jgi:hypothetical protein
LAAKWLALRYCKRLQARRLTSSTVKQAAFDENSKKAAMEGLLREEQEKKATRKQLAETQKAMSADYDRRLNHNRNVSELEALEQKIEVRWEHRKKRRNIVASMVVLEIDDFLLQFRMLILTR